VNELGAALWIKQKDHDPWSYEPKETLPTISEEDEALINIGFMNFTKVRQIHL